MVEMTTLALGVVLSLEVGYYIKSVVYSLWTKFFLTKIHPLKSSRIYGICTTRDIDFYFNHFNNARYMRAMDFGRLDHYIRTGVLGGMSKFNAKLLIAATTIRYRKPIWLFVPYKIQTQIVYWDDKNLYYRQDFITVHDKFLRATAYVKLAVVGIQPQKFLEGVAYETEGALAVPEAPSDLLSWIAYNEQNSINMKKTN